MPRQRFDMGSKWLLQNQGKGALLVGSFTDVRRVFSDELFRGRTDHV